MRWHVVRLLLLSVLLYAVRAALVEAVKHLYHATLNDLFALPAMTILPAVLIIAGLFFGAYAIWVRLVEHRAVHELARRGAARGFAAGLAGGAGALTIVFAIIAAQGCAVWRGYAGFAGTASAAMLLLVGAGGRRSAVPRRALS